MFSDLELASSESPSVGKPLADADSREDFTWTLRTTTWSCGVALSGTSHNLSLSVDSAHLARLEVRLLAVRSVCVCAGGFSSDRRMPYGDYDQPATVNLKARSTCHVPPCQGTCCRELRHVR